MFLTYHARQQFIIEKLLITTKKVFEKSDINIGLLTENQNLSVFEITKNFSCVRFLDQN